MCKRVALLSHAMCNSDAEDKHNQNGLHFESASVNNNNNNNDSNYKNLKSSSCNNDNNDNDSNKKNIVKMKQMKRYSALEAPRKKSPPQLLKSLSLNNGRAMYEEQQKHYHHARLTPSTEGFACFCCQREEPLQTLCSDERVRTW